MKRHRCLILGSRYVPLHLGVEPSIVMIVDVTDLSLWALIQLYVYDRVSARVDKTSAIIKVRGTRHIGTLEGNSRL